MDIVAALFLEGFDLRQVPGPAARLDLTGVYFSLAAPGPFPVTIEPHLVVLVRCFPDEAGNGILEVVFERDGEEVARNVQPFMVDPGKFTYRLVRAEIEVPAPTTIEARCRIGQGPWSTVPLTVLPPVS